MIAASAWYDKLDDYYVIELSGTPALALPDCEIGKPQSWAMFTHGIVAVGIDNRLYFHKIAFVGRQMAPPTEAVLSERLEKAARTLLRMGEQAEAR